MLPAASGRGQSAAFQRYRGRRRGAAVPASGSDPVGRH